MREGLGFQVAQPWFTREQVLRVQVQPGRLEMERSGQGGDELGRGLGRVVGAADVQQDQDAVENQASGSAPGASSVSNNNLPAPARGRGAARVVEERAPELIMENVWLPSCEGRGCIEFVAGLPDLSCEPFEV